MKHLTIKRLLTCTLLASAASATLAAVTLAPTLSAPTELQLGQTEVYKLSVKNTGTTNASGVAIRINLAPGQVAVGPWPTVCSALTAQVFECRPGSIFRGKSRDYFITLRAPSMPQTYTHNVTATGTGAAPAISAPVTTAYQHFSIAITPSTTALWEMRSCGGTAPIANGICPTSSEVVGDARMLPGGVFEDLLDGTPGATWLQTSPQNLRLDYPAGTGYDAWYAELTPLNSRCFRGQGQTVPSVQGQAPFHTGNKICRK